MMPEHENPSGNIFGGVLLSKMDIAGAVAARQVHPGRVVTVAMDSVIFKKPVLRGDLLICWADVVKVGNTSIKTKIRVEVNRNGEIIPVTEAEATYVAVKADGVKVRVGTKDDGTFVEPNLTEYCVACSDGSAADADGKGDGKSKDKGDGKSEDKGDNKSEGKSEDTSKTKSKDTRKSGKKHADKHSKCKCSSKKKSKKAKRACSCKD
ncbi:MAG: acyl-CoA thioesterase [Candidatus Melainabacteria bacterium]|nr:acyl-CoA thioesterase [Candidatus Melainabacteria bacterium]